MTFKLVRKYFTDKSTIGELYLNDIRAEMFLVYILEDKDRGLAQTMSLDEIKLLKQKTITCIPYGKYQIIKTFSPKYKKEMPLLANVKGFEGIRIHSGNFSEHTEGCLLPGLSMGKDKVEQSKMATEKIYKLIDGCISRKELIFIEITKKPQL